jgi:hypothetical protein
MQVYIFQAALLCANCGAAKCAALDVPPGADLSNESTWDSDDYPKGPFADGGGEADSPQHCDDCGVFLENPLTPDGEAYVRDALAQTAAYAALGVRHNPAVADEWREFYALEPTAEQSAAALGKWTAYYADLARRAL